VTRPTPVSLLFRISLLLPIGPPPPSSPSRLAPCLPKPVPPCSCPGVMFPCGPSILVSWILTCNRSNRVSSDLNARAGPLPPLLSLSLCPSSIHRILRVLPPRFLNLPSGFSKWHFFAAVRTPPRGGPPVSDGSRIVHSFLKGFLC